MPHTPTSPESWPSALQQPTPTAQSSQGNYSPNVEWLEQSAERMSRHSSNGSRRSRNSQSRRQPDSRRSSLRSRSQFSSSPHRPYAPDSTWDRTIAEDDEPVALDQPHAPSGNPSHDRSVPNSTQANVLVSRGPSTATESTMKHAGSLFRDFDGTHYTPVAPELAEGYVHNHPDTAERSITESFELGNNIGLDHNLQPSNEEGHGNAEFEYEMPNMDFEPLSERVDIMPSQHHNLQWVEPPPAEDMVYYPAPVPMQLNKPKRLSQLPPPTISAQRRSQVLGSIPLEARQSVVWLSGKEDEDKGKENDGEPHEYDKSRSKQRQSVLNLHKLPPQLRASVFFEQQSVPHKVQVKNGSAVATLDSLLDASAKAPPDASVDDTMRAAVANLHHKKNRSSSLSLLRSAKVDEARASRLSLLPFRISSADKVAQLKQRASSAFGFDATKYDAVGEEDEEDEEDYEHVGDEATPLADGSSAGDFDFEADDDEEYGQLEENEAFDNREELIPEGPESGEAPTTLLAELQLRKQHLRSRTRTAATAFPNGMHSTLLELDAVAQIEKKNRRGVRTTLAWEDPEVVAASREKANDDNVPLAMLYPTKTGLVSKAGGSDWDRPLGLLAKREMEESEPLSKRRNRLKGIDPNAVKPNELKSLGPDDNDDGSEHEGETLAQRTRRLKSAKALNDAIGDGKVKEGNDDFTNDVMSQFGGLNENSAAKDQETLGALAQDLPVEEETLGQRKKRLQAEANAAQAESGRGGLANLLAANPMGAMRQVSSGPLASGLLGQSEQNRRLRQTQITQQNHLSSSNLLSSPLLSSNQTSAGQRQLSGLLGANEHNLQSRRQQLQDTNERIATVGIEAPLVEQRRHAQQSGGLLAQSQGDRNLKQQSIAQHNQSGQPISAFNDQQAELRRQTKSHMSSMFNDGSGGIAQVRASQFPHLQSQSSRQTRGFASSGFGISPQLNMTQNVPYSHQSMAVPDGQVLAHPMQRPSMQSLDHESLSSKQRENIDRWRQSVMP